MGKFDEMKRDKSLFQLIFFFSAKEQKDLKRQIQINFSQYHDINIIEENERDN